MNLAEPRVLQAFLQRHGISAKKGLGQHFLASPVVVEKICQRAANCKSALEIGPGPGVLTSLLCDTVSRVVAVELDRAMKPVLAESAPNAEVIEANALDADLGAILSAMPEPRAVISNLPYYITGPLLTKIAEQRSHFDVAVLMMQKEVAQRILAPVKDSNRGSLSVFLELQFLIEKVCDVPAGAFMPPPKVESTVLQFTPISTQWEPGQEKRLFEIVRGAFRMPRKTLANNLSASLSLGREQIEKVLLECELDHRIRSQFLTIPDWLNLMTRLRSAEPD